MTETVWAVEDTAVIGSIVIVGALTRYALLYFVYVFRAAKMNLKYNLILELMPNEFELCHNAAKH